MGSIDEAREMAESTIAWALEVFPERVALACSFGGASGMVMLDLALRLEPTLPVFVVDTQLLFPETYALIERVEQRYGINVQVVRPQLSVAEQNRRYGDALWARDPDACCALRKIEPLERLLEGYDAWLTAVRREQAETRRALEPLAWDARAQVMRVAPLVEWNDDEVGAYARERELPVNALLYDGYASLGCTHCTRWVVPGEDPRAGRWPGFQKVECGIHGR